MKCIKVSASTDYEVKIGEGLLPTLGAELSRVCRSEKAVIVSDSNVFPLYGEAAKDSLEAAGFTVYSGGTASETCWKKRYASADSRRA